MSFGPPVKTWTFGGRWMPRPRWWGKWEDAHRVPDQKRLTWFYPDFGSYVVKEYITPEQLAVRVRSIERQEAARAHKEAKHQPPIAEQLKAAQRGGPGAAGPGRTQKKAPDRGDR